MDLIVENDTQEYSRSENANRKQRSTDKTSRTHSTIDDIPTNNEKEKSEHDDCFVSFGIVSSTAEKNQRTNKRNQNQKISKTQMEDNENEQDQPAHLVEEIDAIIALIIYDSYSKKRELKFNTELRTKNIRDDIDRFDSLYSCLIDQSTTSQNDTRTTPRLSSTLRDRFSTLSTVKEFQNFQRKEQLRIYEEKKANFNRIPYIPNVLSYQRTCPYYNLEELKWIRDHLC